MAICNDITWYGYSSALGHGTCYNLARTSKMLRKTLMSKQTVLIWKAALSARDAPECPAIYSEPQFADLLFGDNHCQVLVVNKLDVLHCHI